MNGSSFDFQLGTHVVMERTDANVIWGFLIASCYAGKTQRFNRSVLEVYEKKDPLIHLVLLYRQETKKGSMED